MGWAVREAGQQPADADGQAEAACAEVEDGVEDAGRRPKYSKPDPQVHVRLTLPGLCHVLPVLLASTCTCVCHTSLSTCVTFPLVM